MATNPISLTGIIEQANSVGMMLSEQTDKITQLLSQSAATVGMDKAILEQASKDLQLTTSTKLAGDLSTQQARIKIGTDFGTNRQAQNQIYSALAEMERSAWAKETDARQRVQEKQSVDFFSNPLKYIVNQVTVEKDLNDLKNAESLRKAAAQRIQDLNAVTQSSAQVQANFAETLTQESADAAIRLAAVNTQRAMNETELKAIQYNIEAIRIARDAPIKNLELMFQIRSAQQAEEQLGISRRSAARQDMLAQLAIEREKRLAAKEGQDANAQAENESQIMSYVNTGRALRGLAPITDMKQKEVLQILRAGPNSKLGQEFLFDFNMGQQESFKQGTGGARFAENGSQMLQLLQSGIPINTTAEQQTVLTRLKDAVALTQGQNAKQPLDPKDKEGAMKRLQQNVDAIVKQDMDNVRLGDAKNPYSIPTLNVLAASIPSIAANPAYNLSLKKRVEAGEDFTDPGKIITALAEDMRAGKISYAQALSATEIFTRAVAINNESKGFKRFGLPEANEFNAIVDTMPMIPGGSQQVNFLRPDSLGRAIMKASLGTSGLFQNVPSPMVQGGLQALQIFEASQRPAQQPQQNQGGTK